MSAVPFKEVSKLQEACYTVGTTGGCFKGARRDRKDADVRDFSPQLKPSDQAGSDRTVSHGQWRSRRDTFPCG